MRFAVPLLSALACLVSCTQSEDPPPAVQVSLQLATRQSCGVLSGLDYETTCLAAVYVRVVDSTGKQIHEECRPLDERPGELREIVSGAPLITFGGLSTDQVVAFEVRGLHDVVDEGAPPASTDPCASAADTDTWLFWGESGVTDLAVYQGTEGGIVRIVLDCRDCTFTCGEQSCFGCAGLGTAQCPASFPSSFCVPTATCNKTCEDDADCFEGARRCVDGRCDTTQITGQLCSPCGGDIVCGDGYACVARDNDDDGFCAPTCPDELCASGSRCNRLGNNLVLKQ